ncbi:unnamed protein product [Dicrocoelium dendriticum]|nr:unnamed protein product [Dicrocoelium dendriticum]
MIGGEQASNPEIRARQWRRRKYAEDRRRRLEEANTALEDDGIIVGIYETIQDELFHKDKLLQREKQKNASLKMELSDIQSEFEQDRSDYLDTIRRQQRQIDLLKTIIDRIQPCIRRDSNYYNLDKIKRLAKFDEEKNEWVLPQMSVERTQLPATIMDASNHSRQTPSAPNTKESRVLSSTAKHSSFSRDFETEKEEEARYYAKLATRTESTSNYFTSRRVSQLLIDAAALNSGHSWSNGTNDSAVYPPLRASESNTMLHQVNNGGLIAGPEERHSNVKCQRKRETKTENGHSPVSSPTYRGTN